MMDRMSKYKLLLILGSGEKTLLRINLLPAYPTRKFISVQFTSLGLAHIKESKNFLSTESAI